MKYKIIILFCLLFLSRFLFGQYGNEWINYSQTYLEFKVTKEGIYRIDHASLSLAIAPFKQLSTLNPKNIQLFGRGKEIPIYIEGEGDNSFDNTDYIEFYAQPNDGWFDSLLYVSSSEHTNPYYSLFNDTATYYLTWNNAQNNKRFIVLNDLNFPPSGEAVPYFFNEQIQVYKNSFFFGKGIPVGDGKYKYDGHYTKGEGWFDVFNTGTLLLKTISTPMVYTGSGAPPAIFHTTIASNNNPDTSTKKNHHLRIKYGNSKIIGIDTLWHSFDMKYCSFSIPSNELGSPTTPFYYEGVAISGISNNQIKGVSYTYLKYPQSASDLGDASEIKLILKESPTKKTYINAKNFSKDQTTHIYDLTDGYRNVVAHSTTTGSLQTLIPPGGEKICYLVTQRNINTITHFLPVTKTGKFTDFSALDPDSAFIIITHTSLWNSATAYATYRTTQNQDAVLVDVNELYDQFGYGINTHPLSIRNFCNYTLSGIWSQKPQNLFLLGKSIRNATIGSGADGPGSRNDKINYAGNLVPTYGYPSCDNAFTAGLDGTIFEPAIPTGRLSAKNDTEVQNYLQKVITFEAIQNHTYSIPSIHDWLWRKNVMHFGGGEAGQTETFKSYLQEYQKTINKTFFGAKVHEFYKASANIIDFNLADSIKNVINNGVALMTFFGHSSNNSFDISVDKASEYRNTGKYFMIIANGCFSGNIHEPSALSTSEEFVLIPEAGAIAFMASTHLGISSNLHDFTKNYYIHLGKTNYGKSIGTVLKETDKVVQVGNVNNEIVKATIFEMALHGDPSLKLYPHPKPDYAIITPSKVFFTPTDITADLDSFNINLVISNLGKATPNNYEVEIKRFFPTGADSVYQIQMPPVFYQDTLVYRLPVDRVNGIGLNKFQIHVDPVNFISEVSEANNGLIQSDVELWIKSNELIPVFPYNYAVVPSPDITLKASTSDPFSPEREYIIQIDTTDLYNSPLKLETLITQSGGVVTWKPPLTYTPDSVVYFWRASPNHSNTDSLSWREHTFQYITGKKGWGQDGYFQFKKDDYTRIKYNRPNRSFDFDSTGKSLQVTNWGNPQTQEQFKDIRVSINGIQSAQNVCNGHNTPVIFVMVIDPYTLEPWGTADIVNGDTVNYPEHDFGNGNNILESNPNNCGNFWYRVETNFSFMTTNPEQLDSLKELLNNKIPNGHYVMLYSGGRVMWQSNKTMKASHLNAIKNLGASDLSTLGDSIPWIFFVKKGDLSTVKETIGAKPSTFISLSSNLKNTTSYGEAKTDIIGPSHQWGSLHWKFDPLELGAQDSVNVEVLTTNDEIITSFFASKMDVIDLSTYVDASKYPYIKLRTKIQDEALHSCSFLDRWHVLYDYAPEAALNPVLGFMRPQTELNEGQNVSLAISIQNISDKDMDSLRVAYWIEDQLNNKHFIPYSKKDSLRVGQVLYDTITFSSVGLSGNNVLWVDVNPEDALWQHEQYHFNNIARLGISIDRDKINPILDVTFDGVHILDGDIVSPNPMISIQLKDENKYLIMDSDADTSNFRVFLTDPKGIMKQVFFSSGSGIPTMTYTKASLPNNRFKVDYNPTGLSDGVYKLSVQASDRSRNDAGRVDYSISFEVISRSTITQVLNYPNPFSTKTRFAFVLTGSQLPDVFKIQILTVTGKLIREITKDELGPLNIGRNLTDYEWDGRDEYGDFLANGVYIYRVITKINGETIENRQSDADQYFKKGFSKMYLMR